MTKEVRHLKKCIREGIKTISDNTLKDIEALESLKRWCAWVYADSEKVIKEWKKKKND